MQDSARQVLIIDDDEDFRASVGSLLEAEGYAVHMAASGQDGLALARAIHPDLIILDIMMESSTEGYVVNQALRFCEQFEGCHDTPVIMVSSIESSPDELYPRSEEVAMIRPTVYLTKPLDFARFLETVQRLAPRGARV